MAYELLVFAHLGEAQSFLKRENFALVPNFPARLYKHPGQDRLLLICGEGPDRALARTSLVRGAFELSQVFHFGVAGALSKKLHLGGVYPIRTIYKSPAETHMTFESVETSNQEGLDLVTHYKRVLDQSSAQKIQAFGDLVDLEGWSVGYAVKNIPFFSYKVISDFAGAETDCLSVKEKALEFSEKLYQAYLERAEVKEEILTNFTLPQGFYTTSSQSKILKKYLPKVDAKVIPYQSLLEQQSNPKERTKALISWLELYLNPHFENWKKDVSSSLGPLLKGGLQVDWDKQGEKQEILIKGKIANSADLFKLTKSLQAFRWNSFQQRFRGIDVSKNPD